MEDNSKYQKILHEANRLFVLHGYHAISMREIGDACGISKAALYYHFKDKESLFLAILEQYLQEISELIQECNQKHTSLRARLTSFVQSILSHPVDRRSLIRLASQDFGQLSSQAQSAFGITYREKFINRINLWMEEGIRSGELRTINTELATWIFLGMLYPFFYPSQGRNPVEVDSEIIIGIFLDGAVAR
jgi:AcrR family transcriptional regulator